MTAQGEDILAWLEMAIIKAGLNAEHMARHATCPNWGHCNVDCFHPDGTAVIEGSKEVLRRCASDRKLLELHRRVDCGQFGCDCDQKCATCGWTRSQETGLEPVWGEHDQHVYPCPTVRTVAEGYGWTKGER